MPLNPSVRTVTIAVGAATSDAEHLGLATLLAVRTPAELEGTTITFTCCDTLAGTYNPVHEAGGGLYTLTVAASRYTVVNPDYFLGALYIKLVASTNQTTTDTVVTLLVRPIG